MLLAILKTGLGSALETTLATGLWKTVGESKMAEMARLGLSDLSCEGISTSVEVEGVSVPLDDRLASRLGDETRDDMEVIKGEGSALKLVDGTKDDEGVINGDKSVDEIRADREAIEGTGVAEVTAGDALTIPLSEAADKTVMLSEELIDREPLLWKLDGEGVEEGEKDSAAEGLIDEDCEGERDSEGN